MNIRRIRNFLGLRQIDVASATGIAVWRLSKAENGQLRLNAVEMRVLREFLSARMRIVKQAESA